MDKTDCLLEQVAEELAAGPDLRAVTLDLDAKRVSYAMQPHPNPANTATKVFEGRLQHILSEADLEHLPTPPCLHPQDPGSDCLSCHNAAKLHMPAGIRLVPMVNSVLIEKESCPTAPRFWKWRKVPWVNWGVSLEDAELPVEAAEADWRRSMLAAVLCGLAGVAGFLLALDGRESLSIGAYLASYLAGAWYPAQEVWETVRRRVLDVHFLMLAVAVGAASIGHWEEGAILLFLFSFSGALEEYAMHRTRREISGLFKDAPKEANVPRPDGSEARVPVERLRPGMRFRVRPGEQFCVDAVIIEGATSADESNLTGEAIPVDKTLGDPVLGGTINIWGRVDCQVLRPAAESALSKIINLIREAQASKAPSQRFTDRFGTPYTYAILGLSAVMFFVWWLGFGLSAFGTGDTGGERSAFYNAMTLLVVASPCALVLSIPSAILAGIAAGARRGVLFRGGAAIENLARVTHVALDKTGTLTSGNLKVVAVETWPPGREDQLLRVAAALARNSSHPVSRALSAEALSRQLAPPTVERFESANGMGLRGEIALGKNDSAVSARLGRRSFLGQEDWLNEIALPDPGVTETVVEAGDLRGRVLLCDEVRAVSRGLLTRLRQDGLRVTMLTGDRSEAAAAVATQVGLEDYRSALHPEDKVSAIREWTDAGERVAMIGDGVNDAPSLAAADVGVAMGVRGSDAALEQADVVLMRDQLENFVVAYDLSRRARRIILQNLALALGVIVVLVVAALGAAIPLPFGVFGHEGSTVVVVLNSLRLLLPASRVDDAASEALA